MATVELFLYSVVGIAALITFIYAVAPDDPSGPTLALTATLFLAIVVAFVLSITVYG